ncbi:MAG TPA: hypothetical protein VF796_12100 [Humisphaera sp.]
MSRPAAKSSRPAKAASRCTVESLEGRSMMSATLYASDSTGLLFKLNPTTGATTPLFRTPVVMYDLANATNGKLWGVDGTSSLYKIDPAAKTVTKVGRAGTFVNALSRGPDGKLYGAGANNLFTIDTGTGRASFVMSLGGSTSSAGDLAFTPDGKLYLSTAADTLVRINLSTRKATTVGSIGFKQVYGLAYYDGKLRGLSNATEQTFTIDTTTGHGSLTHGFGAKVSGAYGAAVVG